MGYALLSAFAAISLIIHIAAIISTPFADFFNRYPAAFVRAALSYATFLLPISLAEIMLILLIPGVVLLMIYAFRRCCASWKRVFLFSARLIAVASLLFSLFVWTLGTGYRTTPIEDRLELADKETTASGVRSTAELLIAEISELRGEIEYAEDGFSVMPYNYEEMSKKLMEAYGKVCDKYDFISRFSSRLKPVMLSELMTYTHISGVYSYFTGEANINITFPDYSLPYTAAHELAHQRGIAREDEANFVAFLVCEASDDPYIRYSGYVGLLEYMLGAYREEPDYRELYETLPAELRGEFRAYSDFWGKYADNIVGDISGAINDSYLQIQGTPGSISYSLVVDLAVKYFNT